MTTRESLPWGNSPVRRGDVLADKYRVDNVLGVGGMGVVVAATHLHLDQKVALKFMLPQALSNHALVERFGREARAAVRLKSDHVARVLDVGTLPWGAPFMVMEYLEGSDVGAILSRQGALTVDFAVDCVLQACDAVAEAHSLGIVHRDLKPKNLFLTQRNDGRGLVKVLDFGISKTLGGGDLSLTGTSDVLGSPYYMSPEQLKSSKMADERSDIWALGVILYELVTGQVPFRAESVTALTVMVLQDAPTPADLARPGVPRDLALVIARCLEKVPAQRFASIAELAAALQPFAPADSRELATRIGRIGSGSKPPTPMAVSSGTRIAVSGSTAVNWAERTEVATDSRSKSLPWIATVAAVAVVGVIGGFVFASRQGVSRESGPVASVSALAATTPAAPSVTPSSLPSDLPIASAAASASGAASSTPATPAATTAHPSPRPAPPPASSGDQPPRYRTPW